MGLFQLSWEWGYTWIGFLKEFLRMGNECCSQFSRRLSKTHAQSWPFADLHGPLKRKCSGLCEFGK